jgi:predicted amidohydrolase YtcJ
VSPVTTIINARIFDGEWALAADTVIIEGPVITAVGLGLTPRGRVIDGRGSTLVPGLIDSHTHTSVESLGDALRFGVTTELEMGGDWEPAARQAKAAAVHWVAPQIVASTIKKTMRIWPQRILVADMALLSGDCQKGREARKPSSRGAPA